MEQEVKITTEHVVHLVRSGGRPGVPIEAAGTQSTSPAQIVATFRARFAKGCDAGVWKRLSNAIFEPANPFDHKARRQLRQEALILGTLVFAALGLAVYFNVTAIMR
jgi:hypothetical protein